LNGRANALLSATALGLAAGKYASQVPANGHSLVRVFGRRVTRDRVPAFPLALAGTLCLAAGAAPGLRADSRGRAAGRLSLAGIAATAATWWVAAEPGPEGPRVLRLSYLHSLMASDLVALPLYGAAAGLGYLSWSAVRTPRQLAQ
jgi:hypothetical protein